MWHQKSISQIEKETKSNITAGLSRKEAEKRIKNYGLNILPTKKKLPLIYKFIDQFKNFLVIILLVASLTSLLLGDSLDAIAIFAIVLINAVIGFIQELGAEKTLESLKQKEIIYTTIVRQNTVEKIPITHLVLGDILILEEGAKIPADCRIIESFSLRVDESILTGESDNVSKNPKIITGTTVSLGDRHNMIYKDTQIMAGRGKAIVVATAQNTEIGKIAQALEHTQNMKSALTLELEKVGQMLTILIIIIAFLIFIINISQKIPLIESLLISIALSVAAIPEGLPAIVTIVLSLGVKRLAEKKTIIKKLSSVETLGAVNIIATDKTGTLTQNKISVVKISLSEGDYFDVKGHGLDTTGTFFDSQEKVIDPLKNHHLDLLLKSSVLASNAHLTIDQDQNKLEVFGDTTEIALVMAAQRAGINIEDLRRSQPKIYEVPFSSDRKMMSTIVEVNDTGDHILYAKGAPEIILDKCHLTTQDKKTMLKTTYDYSQQGLRSLALAMRKMTKDEVKTALEKEIVSEDNLSFLGLFAMQDPLRPEVAESIADAKVAGIRTIMITGDHKNTALSIAKQAGILTKNDKVLTEEDLEKLNLDELAAEIRKGVSVFARISPLGKLTIINAIKSIPHTQVAVTGDGVNDAPALKASHIGVAMGLTGTDISREVADMVITDDNYATIVDAIRQGRIIYANLVKFIRYLISCNLSEVMVVTLGVIFSTPIPLLPIQLLWINLITDGLPALALGVDPPEYNVMKRPPRDLSVGILHKTRWMYMMIEGATIGITVFILYAYILNKYNYPLAQTIAFSTLALSQLVHAFNNRSTRSSLLKLGVFSNHYLVWATILSFLLQLMVVQTSWGNQIFRTTNLHFNYWIIVIFVSMVPFFISELKKFLRFRILP